MGPRVWHLELKKTSSDLAAPELQRGEIKELIVEAKAIEGRGRKDLFSISELRL